MPQPDRSLSPCEGTLTKITCLAISPDGKRIISSSWDKKIKVWNATTGQEILTLKEHVSPVHGVAISGDGKRIVSLEIGSVKVWDATTGQENLPLKGEFATDATILAFSPDGQRILSRYENETVKVWSAVTGQELPDATDTIPADAGPVAVSPDGRLEARVDGNRILVRDPTKPDSQAAIDRERLQRWTQPDPAYHRREADAAEQAGQHFAAVFHLGRLLDGKPADADAIRKRLAAARGQLKP